MKTVEEWTKDKNSKKNFTKNDLQINLLNVPLGNIA